jgi:DNA-binding transcriptional MerR regulator
MIKILFIPKPLPEESPTSLLKRMAIRHGCRIRSDLQALFGKSTDYRSILSRTHPIVQSVAKKVGENADSFLDGFYEPIGPLSTHPPLKISGLVVRSSMIRKKSAAYCSECGEGSHEYFIKDLGLAIYCPYHMRKYLAKCPHCKAKLHWTALLTGDCACNQRVISPACPPEEASIENKLLHLFREGDADQFRKFEKYLFLLGYQKNDKSECPATRTLVALAFALLEDDKKATFYNLQKLHSLYPEIPKRILCAKLCLIPPFLIQELLKDFLRQNFKALGFQKTVTTPKPLTPFSLSRAQIRAWQKLGDHHWKLIKHAANTTPHNTRFTWKQAKRISEKALELKLRNGFSQKKFVSGLSINYLKTELLLTGQAIKGLIAEKYLSTIRGSGSTSLFALEEVKIFSTKYISIRRLSACSQISAVRIRTAIRHLDLSGRDFNNRRLCLQVMSIATGQLIIDWCKNHQQQKNRPPTRLNSSLPKYHANQSGVWLSTKEAGQLLSINKPTIRYLIRIGALTHCLRSSNGYGYVINKEEVERFRSEYISLTETSNLLHWPVSITRETLKDSGIIPITGLESDEKRPYYFLRQQIVEHATKVEKLRKEHGAAYTISETQQQLCLTLPVILHITNSGILKFSDLTNRTIQKKCVDEFYDNYAPLPVVANWLNIPANCVYRALTRYGIKPIFDHQHNYTRIYLIDDIAKHFPVPTRPNSAITATNKELKIVKVSLLRKTYEFPRVAFGMLFTRSGFTRTIEIYGPAYLLAEDAKKISDVLDQYLLLSQTVKYFGSQQFTRKLILANKLTIARPLYPYSDHPMIEKKSLQDYVTINHLV